MNVQTLKQMIKEPASKEWLKKHGSPKSKALKSHYETKKAVGGEMRFMTKHHPTMKKHRAHEKALADRKPGYDAWRASLSKK